MLRSFGKFTLKSGDDISADGMEKTADICVVIPTYNEAMNIGKILQQLMGLPFPNLWAVVVDDGSPDGTADVVKKISETNHRIILHNRGAKKGLGSAYYEGFKIALTLKPRVILSMDADGSHPVELVPELVKAVEEGADAAVASRYIKGGKWSSDFFRMLVSRGANLLARMATGAELRDMTSGYRAYSQRAVKHLVEKPFEKGYVFQVELLHRLLSQGYKVVEIPLVFMPRMAGKSKLSKKEIVNFLRWSMKMLFARIMGR